MSSDARERARERLKQRAEATRARAKEFDATCPPIAASEREFAADIESALGETAPLADDMRSPDSPCWAAIVEACGHDVALSDAVGKAVLPFLAKSTPPPAGKEAAKLIALLKKADPGGAGPCEIGRGDLHDIVQFLEGFGSIDPLEGPHQTPILQAKTEICPDCGEVHKLVTCPDCGGNSFACLDCLKKTYEALNDPVKNSDG